MSFLTTESRKDNPNFDGLKQERCNSSALAVELHLSRTKPSIYYLTVAPGSLPVRFAVTDQTHFKFAKSC